MIQLLVCETDSRCIELLRRQLGELSLKENVELEVYWLHTGEACQAFDQYIGMVQIALISMKMQGAESLARAARRANSQCRLLIYGGDTEALPEWIPAGPVAYCPQADEIRPELLRLIHEAENGQCIFHFQSRRESLHIPFGSIRYFQSDRRMIRLKSANGTEYEFLCRLDQVEEQVGAAAFIRIHKSYLVSKSALRILDHSAREAVLENGERLPVSSRYFAAVSQWFSGADETVSSETKTS